MRLRQENEELKARLSQFMSQSDESKSRPSSFAPNTMNNISHNLSSGNFSSTQDDTVNNML